MRKFLLFFIILISFDLFAANILFLGDSLTEGLGVDEREAYPSLIQEAYPKHKIFNGGVSGSTTSSGVSRLKWFLNSKIDYLFISLGSNDGLRGIKISKTKENLQKIINLAESKKIKVYLCELNVPTNYGSEYQQSFNQMFKDIKVNNENVTLVDFFLKGVAGVPAMNQADTIHPNSKGHKKIVKNLAKYLKEL